METYLQRQMYSKSLYDSYIDVVGEEAYNLINKHKREPENYLGIVDDLDRDLRLVRLCKKLSRGFIDRQDSIKRRHRQVMEQEKKKSHQRQDKPTREEILVSRLRRGEKIELFGR